MADLDLTTVSALADALKAFPAVTPLTVEIDGDPAVTCTFSTSEDGAKLRFLTKIPPPTPEKSVALLNKELVDSPPIPSRIVPRR